MSVLGLDPSLTCTGWVILWDNGEVAAGAIRTQPVDKKLQLYAGDALMCRLREIRHELVRILQGCHRPERADLLFAIHAEMPVGSIHANTARALAAVQGLLCGMESYTGVATLLHAPQAVKKALAGRKNASKQDMVDAVAGHSTTVHAAIQKLKTKAEREAAADAYGAILAGKMGIV